MGKFKLVLFDAKTAATPVPQRQDQPTTPPTQAPGVVPVASRIGRSPTPLLLPHQITTHQQQQMEQAAQLRQQQMQTAPKTILVNHQLPKSKWRTPRLRFGRGKNPAE